MRHIAVLLLLVAATPVFAQFDLQGYVAGRAINATGPESWRDGGFGRLDAGGEDDHFDGVAQLGFDWTATKWLDLHVSGAAYNDDFGLVEAFADVHGSIGANELRLRAGQFFLPTSRENRGELWSAPYTISFSALNSWIGEEVRPIGAELQWQRLFPHGVVTAAATAFQGNDTMGTLLAWRGWSVGSRLSTYDELLLLPPLGSLQTYFERQRDDGTKPFGQDLDGRTGFAARLRYTWPERWNVQYTWLDNRGDRLLYRGEYAWETHFHLVSAELGDPNALLFAAEYMTGSTGMGLRTGQAFADADFHAAYALISEKRGRNRWTARYDLFGTDDEDHTPAESNDESGRSWTVAWLFDLTPRLRLGAELTQISGDRPAAEQYGFERSTNGRSVTLEARYNF
ncbi:MAG TPA: hypothetical protein VGF48_04450 [Thermoanaerobaculia bacterium]|jgi:hypothetical protein